MVAGSVILRQLVRWCQVWWVVGLTAAGFEMLHLVAAGLAADGFNQHQVHHPNAAEPTSVTKTAECNASQTQCGEIVDLYCVLVFRLDNLPILRIN